MKSYRKSPGAIAPIKQVLKQHGYSIRTSPNHLNLHRVFKGHEWIGSIFWDGEQWEFSDDPPNPLEFEKVKGLLAEEVQP